MKTYILPALALIITTAAVSVTLDRKITQPEIRYEVEYVDREVPTECPEPKVSLLAPERAVRRVEDAMRDDFITALRGEVGKPGSVHLLVSEDWRGEVAGYRLSGVRNDDPIGDHLQNGDILAEVNGIAMRGLEDLRRAIDSIGASGTVRLKVIRDGSPVTVRYDA